MSQDYAELVESLYSTCETGCDPQLVYDAADAIVALKAERDAAVADARLSAFGAWAAEEFRQELGDIDGGTAQDAMLRFGVLEAVAVTEPCGECCSCADYADWPMECYRYPEDVRRAVLAAAQEKKP